MLTETVARWWHSDEGSALIEGAVVLPVLMVLMFGVYEFSWLFYQQHVMSNGLRDAARHLARSSYPCDQASSIWATDEAAAQLLAVTGSVTSRLPRIKGWSPAMISVTCTAIDNPIDAERLRAFRGDAVVFVVTVSSRFADSSLGFFRFLGLKPPIISVSHSERAIGPG